MDSLYLQLKNTVLMGADFTREVNENELYEIIDRVLITETSTSRISIARRLELRRELFNDIKKLDIIQELLEDDSVTEIMINGYDSIFMEKAGVITKWDRRFEDQGRLSDIVQRIAAQSNKIVNESQPISDTRLTDGSRVSIVMNPIAINGPVVTIRKFYNNPLTIERMIEIESISREAADLLQMLVKAKYNIFISGGTGSGKTTFLNALSNFIPKDERIITIEDSAELKITGVSNLVRLEARNANLEGSNEINIRSLIKASLRMRPDRIIVGEVRGGEALDMLQAMNTGHDGSISTGHANSTSDMISRLETMVLMGMTIPIDAIRGQIASAIDIIVHLGRLRDKSRRVLEICEVDSLEDNRIILNSLYLFREEGVDEQGRIQGALQKTGNTLHNIVKIQAAGLDLGGLC